MGTYFKLKTKVEVLVSSGKSAERFVVTSLGGYFPVIAQAPDGTLAVVARDGDIHIGQRGRLGLTVSHDRGESWSHLIPIAYERVDIRNPAFGITSTNRWILAYISYDCYENGFWRVTEKTSPLTFIRYSSDQGQNWSEPIKLCVTGLKWFSPYGKIIEVEKGMLLMCGYNHIGAYLLRSSDDGKTWEGSLISEGFNETAILALSARRFIAVMRRNAAMSEAELWQVESKDGGYTWSKPRRITGPAEHPGDLLLLRSGDVLLSFGHRRPPYGVRAVISEDGGKSWRSERTLVLISDCSTWDVGYPSSVQLPDGSIYTVYYAHDSMGAIKQGDNYPIGVYAGGIRYQEELLYS
ncbi:MAG: hypothetical protein XD60_1088 [Acetothermia bacterium 64_32]|nr:MAG: hypothetical protein XD60_1088 [Acetothermia bacterium 64_32]HAF70266.1 hypothetical protein [Candidatus Acetothermia bacterium]